LSSIDSKKQKGLLAGLIGALVTVGALVGAISLNVTQTNQQGQVSPTVIISPVINAQIGQVIYLNATIDRTNQVITSVVWDQKLGPNANLTQVNDDAYFIPPKNTSYLFTVEVENDKNLITTDSVLVKVGENVTTQPPVIIPPVINNTNTNETTPPVINNTNQTIPPTPEPEPIKDIKVIMVGDLDSGNTATKNVVAAIKKANPDLVAVLGDLGYASDLSWFKSAFGSFSGKLVCIPGNHESANQDGTAALEKSTLAYCGEPFYNLKLFNHALFFGINTNGNLDEQLGGAQQVVMNQTFMKDVKTLHVLTHKPCNAPPNSHHPVETAVKTFCDSLKAKIPSNVKVFFDGAHNHVMSASADGQYKQAGSGGRSHYTCGTSTAFPFCDNVHFGYLEYTIKLDGTTTSQFKDYNGNVVKQ